MFTAEDLRISFIEYLDQGILPTDRTLAHQLKKLADKYFLQNGILFKRGYNGDPLSCLGPKEGREVVREVIPVNVGVTREKEGSISSYYY